MAGARGRLQFRLPECGSATLKVVGAARTRSSVRGSPLRVAADETSRQPRGKQQAQESICGHARSCRTHDRSRQATPGARGSTEPRIPAGETREASISRSRRVSQRVLCDSPSSGHQAQRQRSGRHERMTENVWQPCRASGHRSDPCLAHGSRALAAYVCIVAVALSAGPPCASLSRPGAPQERSLPFPGVCQHRTCVFSPFPADLDGFGVVAPYPGLAALFATV